MPRSRLLRPARKPIVQRKVNISLNLDTGFSGKCTSAEMLNVLPSVRLPFNNFQVLPGLLEPRLAIEYHPSHATIEGMSGGVNPAMESKSIRKEGLQQREQFRGKRRLKSDKSALQVGNNIGSITRCDWCFTSKTA